MLVPASPAAADDIVRPIYFPVEGKVRYTDTWGAPRSGGRAHEGQDLMGVKLQHLLAARDGTITWVKTAGGGETTNGGNMLVVRDAEGWEYWYIHINNDTPGTDDGLNPPDWMFAPGIAKGSKVVAGQFIAYMGDSGNAESTAPHLHFEIHLPDGAPINAYVSLVNADTSPVPARWYLRNGLDQGTTKTNFQYGLPGDVPVVCDWDGNGSETVGVYRSGVFFLRNSNAGPGAEFAVVYGAPKDQPVCGDWDGDGQDTIGVYRNGTFLLRNDNTMGLADVVIHYGDPGDRPVVGDWDGDGSDTIGIFRGGSFFLRDTLTSGIADTTFVYANWDDKPFVGDWDGDGKDSIGVFRAGQWFARNTNTTGVADSTFWFGNATDQPVVGRWDGAGPTRIGVWRWRF